MPQFFNRDTTSLRDLILRSNEIGTRNIEQNVARAMKRKADQAGRINAFELSKRLHPELYKDAVINVDEFGITTGNEALDEATRAEMFNKVNDLSRPGENTSSMGVEDNLTPGQREILEQGLKKSPVQEAIEKRGIELAESGITSSTQDKLETDPIVESPSLQDILLKEPSATPEEIAARTESEYGKTVPGLGKGGTIAMPPPTPPTKPSTSPVTDPNAPTTSPATGGFNKNAQGGGSSTKQSYDYKGGASPSIKYDPLAVTTSKYDPSWRDEIKATSDVLGRMGAMYGGGTFSDEAGNSPLGQELMKQAEQRRADLANYNLTMQGAKETSQITGGGIEIGERKEPSLSENMAQSTNTYLSNVYGPGRGGGGDDNKVDAIMRFEGLEGTDSDIQIDKDGNTLQEGIITPKNTDLKFLFGASRDEVKNGLTTYYKKLGSQYKFGQKGKDSFDVYHNGQYYGFWMYKKYINPDTGKEEWGYVFNHDNPGKGRKGKILEKITAASATLKPKTER